MTKIMKLFSRDFISRKCVGKFLIHPELLAREYKAGAALASHSAHYSESYANSIFDRAILVVHWHRIFKYNNQKCMSMKYFSECLMIYQRFDDIFSSFDPFRFSASQLIFKFLSITDSVKNISPSTCWIKSKRQRSASSFVYR